MKHIKLWKLIAPAATLVLGYSSRIESIPWPELYATYAGDIWWASMVYFIISILAKNWSPFKTAVVALLFAFAIELSQIYHAPWIDQIRLTFPGRMILGFAFKSSDLVCYTVGIVLAMMAEILVRRSMTGPVSAESQQKNHR